MKFSRLDQVQRAIKIIALLRGSTQGMIEPSIFQIVQKFGSDPFLVLVSCLLSLRTRDTVSLPASLRLFEQARTPQQIIDMPTSDIESLIYPVGFYRTKARRLQEISHILIEHYQGTVPSTEAELLALPGVGRKTMALVLTDGFGRPALCVDTHVHRISNRLGLVRTTKPAQTEKALKELLPQEYWAEYNRLIVMWGQNVCLPIAPLCSRCVLYDLCPRVGVTKQR